MRDSVDSRFRYNLLMQSPLLGTPSQNSRLGGPAADSLAEDVHWDPEYVEDESSTGHPAQEVDNTMHGEPVAGGRVGSVEGRGER